MTIDKIIQERIWREPNPEQLKIKILCRLKLLQRSPINSTFEDVERIGESHNLYKCIACSGKEDSCKDYKGVMYLK